MFITAAANTADIIVAVVAAIPAVLTVLYANHKQNAKLDKVGHAVATSNGKTAGNYIEEVYHRFEQLEVDQTVLLRQILDLATRSDSRFATVDRRLQRLEDMRSGTNLD